MIILCLLFEIIYVCIGIIYICLSMYGLATKCFIIVGVLATLRYLLHKIAIFLRNELKKLKDLIKEDKDGN